MAIFVIVTLIVIVSLIVD